ncbi:MAG: pyrophosphate--fructose-6-phosphate 1-phosphotransferase [Omnitrophica bacterium RBG_13_46_9]|nr:MAG: pyrophosphate--fructose-6-phosphate 1-phosphotransferase [Omnitrophica bacterium RBG_13_46_9]
MNVRRIGVLTGGGDCPGLNPAIRAIVKKAIKENLSAVGIRNGWKGLIENETFELDSRSVSGILPKGGTILGTSRTNPYKDRGNVEKVKKNFASLKLDALIAIGGEDTLGVASKLCNEGLNIVGVPKTIDNDLSCTDFTLGFDTAVNIATEAIDRLHTTAESHHRIMVVEIMGRHAGWIAIYAGIAGGADFILIPEVSITLDEVCTTIKKRHETGKDFSIIVVAEGAKLKDQDLVLQTENKDAFDHVVLGGIGNLISREIEQRLGYETRVTVLGHVQRGGTPSAFDRVLATRLGVKAVELVLKGEFGKMVAFKGKDIVNVPLQDAAGAIKTVDQDLYEIAKTFFG